MAAVDPSNALPAVPAQTTAAEPVTAGAVAAPPPEPAAEAPVQADLPRQSDAGCASAGPGRCADGADERQRLRAGRQPGRQRLGRAGERRRSAGRRPRPRRPPLSISRIRRSIRRRYRPPRRRRPIRRRRRHRQSPPRPPTVGRGTGSGIAAMRCRISRSRRRSGHRTGPGTGIGIAEIRIQYRKIPSGKNRRSINPVLRSIGRSISTSRSASTVPGNDGPVSQTNVAVVLAAPALPKLRIEVPGRTARREVPSAARSGRADDLRQLRSADVHGRDRRRDLRRSGRTGGRRSDDCCAAARAQGRRKRPPRAAEPAPAAGSAADSA